MPWIFFKTYADIHGLLGHRGDVACPRTSDMPGCYETTEWDCSDKDIAWTFNIRDIRCQGCHTDVQDVGFVSKSWHVLDTH